MEERPRLARFEPDLSPPSTNGSHLRRRRSRFGVALTFGFLLGSLVATGAVPRLQWLNLGKLGWWGRPALAGLAAGLLAGALFRGGVRGSAVLGAGVALLAVVFVYAMVRAAAPVLFVERSFARVVVADVARLALFAGPPGALGAVAAWRLRGTRRAVVDRAPRG